MSPLSWPRNWAPTELSLNAERRPVADACSGSSAPSPLQDTLVNTK